MMKEVPGLLAIVSLLMPLAVFAAEPCDLDSLEFMADATAREIESCIDSGSEVNIRNEHGYTPLHLAAAANPEPEIIAALLAAGAEINSRGKDGVTPLHLAAFGNSEEIIMALLDAGADPLLTDSEGKTVFDYADRNPSLKYTEAYQNLAGRFYPLPAARPELK